MLVPVENLPLFAYGPLLEPEFVGHLLERPVAAEPARLVGYALVELAGLPHPVLEETPDGEVEGRLYRDLSAEDYERLDAYQGVGEGLYRRDVAKIAAAGSAEAREAVYVFLPRRVVRRRYG